MINIFWHSSRLLQRAAKPPDQVIVHSIIAAGLRLAVAFQIYFKSNEKEFEY